MLRPGKGRTLHRFGEKVLVRRSSRTRLAGHGQDLRHQRGARHSLRNVIARLLVTVAVLALLAPAWAAEPTIFLVRHAEKAEATTGNPKDPELSEIGRRRAESLALTLKDAGITSIYVTELKRTQQTAEPLARSADLRPSVVPAKDAPALVTRLNDMIGNVLVVGHSNTIPEIIKALGAPEPVAIADSEYDNLFIWRPGASPQLIRLHYR